MSVASKSARRRRRAGFLGLRQIATTRARATSMAGGSETWASSREIEGGLAPPSAEDDPEGVFGEGLVVDCVSRVGVLAMPADVAVGLNLQGTSEARQRAGEAGTWEFAPSAAELLRSYLAAHPAIVAAVVRSAHSADGRVAPGGSRFRVGKFLRGVSPAAAAAARAWRARALPEAALALDAAHEARGKKNEREEGGVGRIAGGTSNARTRRLARRAAGEGPLRPPEADTRAARDGVAAETAQDGAKQKPVSLPPSRILIPAEPPAVPAWNAASAAAGASAGASGSMAEILAEEAGRAQRKSAGDAARRSGAGQTASGRGGVEGKGTSGSFADLLRGRAGARGGGASAGWAVRSADSAPSGLQTPAPPKLPKVTPESLAAEARRSKIDGFGKIRCLVCGRTFKSYGPLEQHLAASHFGLNSSQAKALEAALLASGRSLPGDGSQKTKPDRVALQLGQILEQPRRGEGVASLAASLSAYIREAKPSKADRRAAAASASGPKGRGKMVMNPNKAMSSGLVMRRGKEREGPKKKKRPTKLKRIILTARAARDEARAEKEASETAEANGGEAERGGDEADDREVEVTVEVGRVYVNLLFAAAEAGGGDAGRVGVDLIFLEDEDEDEDEAEDEAEADHGEVRAEMEMDDKETAVDETERANDETSAAAPAPKVPERAEKETAVSSSMPEPDPVSLPSNPWAISGGFRDALLRAEAPAAEAGGASDETKKKKRKPKAPRAPGDGPREKGATRACETCGVTCSGDDAWADHLKGKTHAKNERRREREREAEANGGPVGDARRDEQKKGTAQRTFVGADAEIRYSDQIISSETNVATASCVSELKRFQDRAYHQDPVKAKMRRRLVFGLREVAKAVQLKKAKAVVVAPNIEEVGLEGGLDDVVAAIIDAARGNGTPIVFALTRNRLGQIVGKRLRISALAVLDQSGADEQFKAMLAAAAAGRAAFKEEAERKKEKAAAEAARAETGAGASGSASSGSDRDEGVPSLNAAASTFVPRARAVPS